MYRAILMLLILSACGRGGTDSGGFVPQVTENTKVRQSINLICQLPDLCAPLQALSVIVTNDPGKDFCAAAYGSTIELRQWCVDSTTQCELTGVILHELAHHTQGYTRSAEDERKANIWAGQQLQRVNQCRK